MILSGFIITIGGINKESYLSIHILVLLAKHPGEGWKKKKKRKERKQFDRAQTQIPNENVGDSGVGLD